MADKGELNIVGIMSNGLVVYKKQESEVLGVTYYSEENCPSDVSGLPVINTALTSIECLEIILNDMKKVNNGN